MRSRTSNFWYMNQIKNFSIDSFSTFIEFSIDTLMGETKPIDLIQSFDLWQLQKESIEILMQQIEPEISEKIELEHRDKSKIIAPFVTFGPSAFCWKEENRHLFNLNVWSELKFFNWDLDGKNRAPTNVETWFWTPRWLRTQPSVRSRRSKVWYKNQIKNFSIKPLSTITELLTDTLMRETKRVATQNIEFEGWVKSVCKSVFGTLVQPGFWCNKKID